MTKLITLLAFLYLFTFTIADQQTIKTIDLAFDDNDDENLATEPLFLDIAESVDIKAIEEASKVEIDNGFEPIETIETGEDLTFTIIEEETMIPLVEETDLQGPIVVEGGEVIVDSTENGEAVQAEVEQEEAKIDYVENGELIVQVEDDITSGEVTNIVLVENEESNFTIDYTEIGEAVQAEVEQEEAKIDYVEDGELIVQVEDDITSGEVTNIVLVDNEEDGELIVQVEDDITSGEVTNIVLVDNEEDGITAVIANPGEPGDDEEEEFKTEETDVVNDGEIPVLVLENAEDEILNEEATIVLVNEESEITSVIAFADVRADDEEEESFIDSQESDDANEGEIPVLPVESEVAQVLANPGLPGDDEEEEADINSQESDDANEGEIPVLPDEQEVTQGFVDPDVKADDEEEPIDTDGLDDGEPEEPEVVVFPEDQAGEDGVTPGIVVTQDFSDDAGEELADDVDARDDIEPDGGASDSAVVSERGFLGRN